MESSTAQGNFRSGLQSSVYARAQPTVLEWLLDQAAAPEAGLACNDSYEQRLRLNS
jgi:hypothetical protein